MRIEADDVALLERRLPISAAVPLREVSLGTFERDSRPLLCTVRAQPDKHLSCVLCTPCCVMQQEHASRRHAAGERAGRLTLTIAPISCVLPYSSGEWNAMKRLPPSLVVTLITASGVSGVPGASDARRFSFNFLATTQ